MNRRVLTIEDDPNIGRLISEQLTFEGFQVEIAPHGAEGLAQARTGSFALIFLDLMLPDTNGFQILTELRASGIDTPVIILTSRDQAVDKVRGLDLGADDYLTKPFDLHELLARVRAVLRRARSSPRAPHRLGELTIDSTRREVLCGSRQVSLTLKEFQLLELLAAREGEVISRDEFMDALWSDVHVSKRTVDTHMASLRRKLHSGRAGSPRIDNVRGVGYKLTP